MITRASFRNFKSLREVDVTFDSRLTVLVGPNGSGKSSILKGLDLMCRAGSDLNRAVGHNEVLSSRTSGTTSEVVSLACEAGRNPTDHGRFSVKFDSAGRPGTPPRWSFGMNLPDGFHEWAEGHQPPGVTTAEFSAAFGPSVLLRMDIQRLAAPSGPDSIPATVKADGSGLAPALSELNSDRKPDFDRVVDEFRRIIPSVVDVRFETVSVNPYMRGILIDFRGAPGIRAADVSTGTLHALGLLTVILGPSKPRVVLLDDIDQGLHPKAQMDLVGVLRRLLDQHAELQIVAASHSPYILGRLEWNEVRVTSLADDGAAACRALTAHPDYGRWHDAMSPGEFWSHAGEEWVTKAPAVAAP